MDTENPKTTTAPEATVPTVQSSNDHVSTALDSMKKIPKQEELRGFSLEKLFDGRLDVMNYRYAIILCILVGVIISSIPIIGFIISLIVGVVGIAGTARRFRDINLSGWWALLGLLGPIGILVAIYLAFAPAVNEGNKFGPSPDPKRPFFYAMLNI